MPSDMDSLYRIQPAGYYAEQMGCPGIRGRWFRKRQKIVGTLVDRYHEKGVVLDLGCGNSLWNERNKRTVGVDISHAFLCYNRTTFSSFFPLRGDLAQGIPCKDGSVDVVVAAEVLEHFQEQIGIISEIRRVLKKEGHAIISVPYGIFPGVWSFFFPAWCWFKGYKDKDPYYLNQCGHKVNFDMRKLQDLFSEFDVIERFHFMYLTIFLVVQKV